MSRQRPSYQLFALVRLPQVDSELTAYLVRTSREFP